LKNSSIVIASRDQRRGDPEKQRKPAVYGLPRSLKVARNDKMTEFVSKRDILFRSR